MREHREVWRLSLLSTQRDHSYAKMKCRVVPVAIRAFGQKNVLYEMRFLFRTVASVKQPLPAPHQDQNVGMLIKGRREAWILLEELDVRAIRLESAPD